MNNSLSVNPWCQRLRWYPKNKSKKAVIRQLLHVLLIFSNLSYSCDSNVLLHKFDYKLEERPAQAYNEQGEIVWSAEYDIYGKITKLKGEKTFIPFRQLGQYEDPELDGLYYNRFRYYDASTVLYLSQDLIIPQDALEHTPIAQDNHNDKHIKTRTYRVKDRTTQKTDSGRPFKMSFKQQLLINIINL